MSTGELTAVKEQVKKDNRVKSVSKLKEQGLGRRRSVGKVKLFEGGSFIYPITCQGSVYIPNEDNRIMHSTFHRLTIEWLIK